MRQLQVHEKQILTAVQDAVSLELSAGYAKYSEQVVDGLDAGMVYAQIVPTRPDSALIGIQIDNEQLVTMYIGRHGTLIECFEYRTADLAETVSKYVRAVLSGYYEEWIPRQGRPDRAIAKLIVDRKPVCVRYNTLWPAMLVRRRWRHITYVSYID